MTLFSRLFRKPDPQPLGMGPLHPERNPFHSAVPTLRIERFAEAANAATDPPAAGNGAPSVQPFHGLTAPDFDMLECLSNQAVAALIGANEDY